MTSYFEMVTVPDGAMWVLWFLETKSVIKMQRRYRIQYGNNPPSDNAIRRWLKQFQGTDNVLHRKGAGRSSTLLESRMRLLEAQKNQLDELFFFCS
jgi:hypothetical protein